jgi:hypothetical protein
MNLAEYDLLVAGETVRIIGRRHALVASHSAPGDFHTVEQDEDGHWSCSCRGWEFRKRCRHLDAVREWALGRMPGITCRARGA